MGGKIQIMNMLELISFGPYFFEIALLLRESIMINSILTNVELWYNLTKNEIKEFEDLDKLLFTKLLEVPQMKLFIWHLDCYQLA